MQGKRIIIAHNWNETSFNTQSVKLAEALSKENYVVFISQMRVPNTPLQINPNLKVLQWPNGKPRTFKDIKFCYSLMKEFKPDITISHFTAQTIMSFLGKMVGIKNRISWYHTLLEQLELDFKGSSLKFAIQKLRRKFILNLTTNIVTVSNYAQTEINARYGIPKTNIKVINNGVANHSLRNNSSQLNFVFLGRYDECKGLDILIKAIAIVKQQMPNVNFSFAGGKLNNSFSDLIKKESIEDAVQNIGYLQYDKVPEYLCKSYALIVPSRIDNLPTVVLEAFSCGTPVIGSKAGGIPEMIEDGINGLLFEKENPQSLAEKIIELASNTERRGTMSINARNSYEQKFMIEHYVKNVTSLLGTLS